MAAMRKYAVWVMLIVLLACGAVICTIRWQAWFGMPPEPEWTEDTINYHFYCFGEDSVPMFSRETGYWQDTLYPDTLDIMLLGDVHSGMSHEDYDTIAQRLPNIDCYAQLGDWMERGYGYYQQQLVHALRGTRLEQIPVLPCPGNHEYMKGIKREISPIWTQMFCNPQNGPLGLEGTTYYVDFNGLRFIVLDTQRLRYLRDYTRLNVWLTEILSTAGDMYTVVMMHHPVYSSAAGRFNPCVYLSCVMPLRRADLVFSGHDHQYARQRPYVAMTSCVDEHEAKLDHYHERQGVQGRYYVRLALYNDTLHMTTYELETAELYDECVIAH